MIRAFILLSLVISLLGAYDYFSVEAGAGVLEKPSFVLGVMFNSDSKLAFGAGVATAKNDELIAAPKILSRFKIIMTKRASTELDVGGGVFFRENDKKPFFEVSVGGSYLLTCAVAAKLAFGVATAGFESDGAKFGIALKLEVKLGFSDKDHDWVVDRLDRCPKTPEGALVDKNGCALDSDADGVFDGIDKCPNTPLAALVDSTGCPEDSDSDGVYDGVDRCPNTPKGINVDSVGCPVDSDHDGVPDYADSCSNTPSGAVVDLIGCPRDSDEDGVLDGLDQCPGTPTGFEVDRFGCPKIPPVEHEEIENLFRDNLELTASALNKLQRLALRLRAYPARKIKMLVYTDIQGSPAYNRRRARKVGEKIVQFLKGEGVDPKQIEVVAMGERDPVIRSYSAEAKRKNRRVVFVYEEK